MNYYEYFYKYLTYIPDIFIFKFLSLSPIYTYTYISSQPTYITYTCFVYICEIILCINPELQ